MKSPCSMYVMPTLDPLLTFSDLILTPTPISLAMFLPPRLPSFVTSDHAFDLVLISILLVLMITVSSEDFMYLALFIFVEYSTFVDISSLILLVLYTYILIIPVFFFLLSLPSFRCLLIFYFSLPPCLHHALFSISCFSGPRTDTLSSPSFPVSLSGVSGSFSLLFSFIFFCGVSWLFSS